MTLIASLQQSGIYPHPVTDIEVFETHISWVILTGQFAYKIKKAVKLDFLDFSTLELRRHYCEEELRLNRRWAPELYLDVVAIGGSHERPSFGGATPAIEYAVKMQQFEQERQLDRQLDAGLLSNDDMRELAATIDGYHVDTPILPYRNDADAIAHVSTPMLDNFAPLEPLADAAALQRVHEWTEQCLHEFEPELIQRRKNGFVRECHGDLHLTNLVRLSSGIAAYDCVEFGLDFRTMDVISDVSFLAMDLVVRGHEDLAYVLLNRYLECNGDYAGMSLFGLYLVYHCMIRAKIAAIRSTERRDESARRVDLEEMERYVAAALDWIARPAPMLIVMHGYSASGKTWLSSKLLPVLPAIRVRSDIERKRLHGLEELARSGSGLGQGIYTGAATSGLYAHMLSLAGHLLRSGLTVVLDASFLKRHFRQQALALAESRGAGFLILDVTAPQDELVDRLRKRAVSGDRVSEADTSVLRYQVDSADPLDEDERRRTITVASERTMDVDRLIGRIWQFNQF